MRDDHLKKGTQATPGIACVRATENILRGTDEV
jgi:hypothetical protein